MWLLFCVYTAFVVSCQQPCPVKQQKRSRLPSRRCSSLKWRLVRIVHPLSACSAHQKDECWACTFANEGLKELSAQLAGRLWLYDRCGQWEQPIQTLMSLWIEKFTAACLLLGFSLNVMMCTDRWIWHTMHVVELDFLLCVCTSCL